MSEDECVTGAFEALFGRKSFGLKLFGGSTLHGVFDLSACGGRTHLLSRRKLQSDFILGSTYRRALSFEILGQGGAVHLEILEFALKSRHLIGEHCHLTLAHTEFALQRDEFCAIRDEFLAGGRELLPHLVELFVLIDELTLDRTQLAVEMGEGSVHQLEFGMQIATGTLKVIVMTRRFVLRGLITITRADCHHIRRDLSIKIHLAGEINQT